MVLVRYWPYQRARVSGQILLATRHDCFDRKMRRKEAVELVLEKHFQMWLIDDGSSEGVFSSDEL